MQREKSSGVIIYNKEGSKIYYLLLHYELGHWDFAKGHIEKGEEEKETARREVEEETGIKNIEFIHGFREKIQYFFRKTYEKKEKPPLVFKEVIFYLARTRQKEVKISFEHLAYQWLTFEKTLQQLTFKNARDILKKAHKFLQSKNKNND